MKRIRIALIIMAALLVASMAVFFVATHYSNNKAKEEQAEEEKLVLFDFSADDADRVEIHNESGDFNIVFDNDLGWILEDSDEFAVNATAVSAVTTIMSELSANEILENKDASRYGFDDPIRIVVTSGGEEHVLLVGDPSPTYENVYVMKENDDNIYIVSYDQGSVFSLTKDSLKNPYILNFYSSEVEEFCLWQGEEKDENILFHIITEDEASSWHMLAPYVDDSVYNTDVSAFINDVIRDEITGFVQENCTEDDYSKYGFDNPQYVFEISGKNKQEKVIFGDLTEDETEIYLLLTSSGQVAKAAFGSVSLLGYDTSDMLNAAIYSEAIKNVTNVDLTLPGAEVSLEIDSATEKYICNGVNVSDFGEEAVNAYLNFYDMFNNTSLDIIEQEADPDGEPTIEIDYTLSSNVTVNIKYIPVSDDPSDGYYALKNDEYTGFVVKKDTIEYIINAYEELLEIIEENN